MRVVDSSASGKGKVVVLAERVPINVQRRNLVGLTASQDGASYYLDALQALSVDPSSLSESASTDEMKAAPVAPSHFRLLFSHAALTMPTAKVYANDDLEIADVAPGGHGSIDHPLLPPHQAGRVLKVSTPGPMRVGARPPLPRP